MNENDTEFMRKAIDAARKSLSEDNRVHPMVGAVIIRATGEVAVAHRGEGAPGDHAEFTALKAIGDGNAVGATVYATLEPCTTRKESKTPCADRLIAQGARRVVIGMLDPNPAICGRGLLRLQKHGRDVELFPQQLAAEVIAINEDFIRHYESRSPAESTSQEVVSLVNPRYDHDLAALDGKWLLEPVISSQTVVIVTADTVIGELLDRPTAALVRDEIDRRGGADARRRGIVVGNAVPSDRVVPNSPRILGACPKIYIGSEAINPATKAFQTQAAALGNSEFQLPGGVAIFANTGKPEVAIWGPGAADTHGAAVGYINAERGLTEFLRLCWK